MFVILIYGYVILILLLSLLILTLQKMYYMMFY